MKTNGELMVVVVVASLHWLLFYSLCAAAADAVLFPFF
jgi:hypothetical protein